MSPYTKEFADEVNDYIGINSHEYIPLLRKEYKLRFNWFAFLFPLLWALYRRVKEPLIAVMILSLMQNFHKWLSYYFHIPWNKWVYIALFALIHLAAGFSGSWLVHRNFHRWRNREKNKRSRPGSLKTIILYILIRGFILLSSFLFFVLWHTRYTSLVRSVSNSNLPVYILNLSSEGLNGENSDLLPGTLLKGVIPEETPVSLIIKFPDEYIQILLKRKEEDIDYIYANNISLKIDEPMAFAVADETLYIVRSTSSRMNPSTTLYKSHKVKGVETVKLTNERLHLLEMEVYDKKVHVKGVFTDLIVYPEGETEVIKKEAHSSFNLEKIRNCNGNQTALLLNREQGVLRVLSSRGQRDFPMPSEIKSSLYDFYCTEEFLYLAAGNTLYEIKEAGDEKIIHKTGSKGDEIRHIIFKEESIILITAWSQKTERPWTSMSLGITVLNHSGTEVTKIEPPLLTGYSFYTGSLEEREFIHIVYIDGVSRTEDFYNHMLLDNEGNILRQKHSKTLKAYIQLFIKRSAGNPDSKDYIMNLLVDI